MVHSLLGRCGAVSFAECAFSSLRGEAEPMFEAHWREASNDLSIPVDVAWDSYQRLELFGMMACVVARDGERLVGYAVYILHPSLHYRGLVVGDADVFYLDPAYRRGWVGVRLFQCCEDVLRRRGAAVMQTRVKEHVMGGRVASIMRYLRCRKTESAWRKALL
jgi:GNAT superfamily N-acetyltransferase